MSSTPNIVEIGQHTAYVDMQYSKQGIVFLTHAVYFLLFVFPPVRMVLSCITKLNY